MNISMELYMETFQPEKYESWVLGKDMGCHPEDNTHGPAPPPAVMNGYEP